jgi:hypothetical protein
MSLKTATRGELGDPNLNSTGDVEISGLYNNPQKTSSQQTCQRNFLGSESNFVPTSETDFEALSPTQENPDEGPAAYAERNSQKSIRRYGSPSPLSQVKAINNANFGNHHRKNTSLGAQSDLMKDIKGSGIPGFPMGNSRKSSEFHNAINGQLGGHHMGPRTNCKKHILEDICIENQRLFANKSRGNSWIGKNTDGSVEKVSNLQKSESLVDQKRFDNLFLRKDEPNPKSVRPFSTKFLNLKTEKTNRKRLDKKRLTGFVVS